MSRLCAYVECNGKDNPSKELVRRPGEDETNFKRRNFCNTSHARKQMHLDKKLAGDEKKSWDQRTKIDDGSYKLFMGKHGA